MKKIFLSSLLIALFIIGCAKKPSETGRAQFAGYGCSTCHRVGDQGGVLGPDLTTIGFRKNEAWLELWLKNPPEWKQHTLMPNFFLKDHVRKDIIAYLVSLKGEIFREGTPPWDRPELMNDPIKRGEVIFDRVGCAGCHGKTGKGGNPNNNVVGGLIPSLTRVAEGFSKEELKDKIRKGSNPAPEDSNAPPPMIEMPAWGEFLKEDEMDALVEYLYSIAPAPASGESWE